VDYRTAKPLHKFLSFKYGNNPFDSIFDTIGSQELFKYSPQYLKPEGAVVNVGNFEGPSLTVFRSVLNRWLPIFLGGIPRKYSMISTTPNGLKARILSRMVEDGQLRVLVDEVVDFENAMRVSDSNAFTAKIDETERVMIEC